MPSKSNKSKSSENQLRADEMRKTILRNPELPLEDFPPLPHDYRRSQASTSSYATSSSKSRRSENQENDQPCPSTKYHLPKMNTGNGLRQKLKEVSQYRTVVQSMSDLTIGTKQAVNKEVRSSHLFFSCADASAFSDLIEAQLQTQSKDFHGPRPARGQA